MKNLKTIADSICTRRAFSAAGTCAAAALLCMTLACGCRTADAPDAGVPERRVRIVAIAGACTTNGITMARRTNSDAIAAAGFLPVILPEIADTNLLEYAMDHVDALVITGALKGAPSRGREPFEHLLMRMAIERGLPVLGFCHGHQAICSYFGGKIDRIPADLTPKVVHHGKESPFVKDCFHEIEVKPGSRLAEGLGATRFTVNSSHYYHVTGLGDELEVVARSDDGVIEAVEHRTLPVTGFQFHPERIFRKDPRYLRIISDALTAKGKGGKQ